MDQAKDAVNWWKKYFKAQAILTFSMPLAAVQATVSNCC